MPFEHNIVIGTNIEDAWRNAMWCCIRNGYLYRVAKGSYEGQLRKQLDYVAVRILDPWKRPLAASTPEGSAIPSPTSEDKIWSYFNEYIIGDQKEEGEDYTYGQYIAPQLPKAVDMLNFSKGDTNQSCITIGDQGSINLNSPPSRLSALRLSTVSCRWLSISGAGIYSQDCLKILEGFNYSKNMFYAS